MKNFKVIQSNPNSKGGFVTKIQSEIIVSDVIFGDKVSTLTYYISGTKQVPVDMMIPESALFPKYKVVEHPMVNPTTGEEFMGKWLHVA
jgi:hypothetical protein